MPTIEHKDEMCAFPILYNYCLFVKSETKKKIFELFGKPGKYLNNKYYIGIADLPDENAIKLIAKNDKIAKDFAERIKLVFDDDECKIVANLGRIDSVRREQ